jgi:hypothetical protein
VIAIRVSTKAKVAGVVAPALFVFGFLPAAHEDVLVVFQNNVGEEGAPLFVVHMATGMTTAVAAPFIGCGGVVEAGTREHVELYCIAGRASTTHAVLDISNHTVEVRTIPDLSDVRVHMHPSIVLGSYGKRFYAGGGSHVMDARGDMSDAHIIVLEGRKKDRITLPENTKPYFIKEILFDSEREKLWVLRSTAGDGARVDRIDVTTLTVDATVFIDTYLGYDMLLHNGDVFVSAFRSKTGADVTVIDGTEGAMKREITLPVHDISINAFALASYGNDVLVSTVGGLAHIDGSTLAVAGIIANNPESVFTFITEWGEAYYAISDYEEIHRIEKKSLTNTEILNGAESRGLTSLIPAVNTISWYEKLWSRILSV